MRVAAGVLSLAAVLAAGIMPAAARDLDAKFLIERKGKVIGFHKVDVERTDFGKRVDTQIEMRVGLGPITLFRYDHKATEIWRDGTLISLVSQTDNNGEAEFVDAKRYGAELVIEGSAFEGPAPAGALPSSYWNKALVQADAMINTQNGEIIDIAVTALGETQAPDQRLAEQFRLVGSLALDLWYEDSRWTGANFVIDGEELTYVRVVDERQFAALEELVE